MSMSGSGSLNGWGVRVAVCAEESSMRSRVVAVLRTAGHELVAEEASPAALAATGRRQAPTCVVLAAERPTSAAARAADELRATLGADSSVLVCGFVGDGQLRRALAIGVSGVVLADELDRALALVVTVVGAGQVSVPREMRDHVRAAVLTTREKQILGLVVMGMSNGQIARKLYLAESTVKSHLSSAFAKLGVSSRNEAVTVILDPDRGRGLGILGIPADRIPSPM
jgi:DNA-binding NarL/FixJ family response regulator